MDEVVVMSVGMEDVLVGPTGTSIDERDEHDGAGVSTITSVALTYLPNSLIVPIKEVNVVCVQSNAGSSV